MSIQKITPFMWFDKKAEEAVNFYISIFKNSKLVNLKRYPDGPLEGPMQGMEGKVLTAVFELEGQRFMAIDGGPQLKPSGAISFLIECKDQEEIDYYWNHLTEGGDPARQECGWLQDKFGFSWQVVPNMSRWLNDSDTEKSNRAFQAMLSMKKIDIAALDAAYNG